MKKNIIRRHSAHKLRANFPDFLCQVYSNRGITCESELAYQLKNLFHYEKLKGIQAASKIIATAIDKKQKILIIGDFDCDGATSTALCVLSIRAMGGVVDFLIPNRFHHGYGLSVSIVELAEKKKPALIITVDNGISSIDGVALAREKGIKVVITDHHLSSKYLPNADAIVNPNQQGCGFQSKNTAGVGVAFYTMCAVKHYLKNHFQLDYINHFNPFVYLDLVALGTIADVVPLDKNNRILIYQGLQRIRVGHCRLGIKVLLNETKRTYESLVSQDLAFILGPRINAAGRIDDMSIGVELLLSDNPEEARYLAKKLNELNSERRCIEQSMTKEAENILLDLKIVNKLQNKKGICLYQSGWHQGVIGIMASRIKDKYHRPVIVFADTGNGELKGSGRSIDGLHLKDLLDEIVVNFPDLIINFGGHAMAAGLTIKFVNMNKFFQIFDNFVGKKLTDSDLSVNIYSDGYLSSQSLTLQNAELIYEGGPWGNKFSTPQFDGVFEVVQQILVGKKHLKILLKIPNKMAIFEAIVFNVDTNIWPNVDAKHLEIVYQLDVNKFRNQNKLQLKINYFSLYKEALPTNKF